MTKIKNYELDSTINEDDKVIGTDGMPGANFGRTKNYSIASLVAYIDTQLDPVDGSGTLNTIPIWTPDGDTLGDSIMTYDTGNTAITVNGKLVVTSSTDVQGNLTAASLTLQGYLADAQGQFGSAGQLLSSTVTGVDWIDAPVSGVQGSGTLNTLPMWTPDGVTLGDSIIKKDTTVALPNEGIVIEGKANIHGINDGVSRFVVSDGIYNLTDATFSAKIIDASNSSGTLNQVLTSTGTQTSWQDFSALVPNNITGSGTVEYIPKFTPDGTAIGNSIMFTKANGIELQVGVSGGTETTLGAGFMSTGGVGADTVTATNINAGATGTLTASGNIILGDATADTTTINSTLSILSVVKDSTDTVGTVRQVLAANAASELLWEDQIDTKYSVSSQQAASDVEITLLGSDATETEVTLVAGNSISLTDNGSNQITIAATGGAANTTYVLDHTQSAGSVSIELSGSDGSLTDYVLTAGTGVSFDNSVSGTTSIGVAADNVTGTGAATRVAFWDTASTLTSDADLYWWTANPEGRLGIGTSTPNTALHVAGTFRSNDWSYFSTDGPTSLAHLGGGNTTTSQFNITSTAAGGSFISATNKLSLRANNTTAIHIDNTSKVGIGTTTPFSALDVVGDYISIDSVPFVKYDPVANATVLGDVASLGDNVVLVTDTGELVKLSGDILELGNTNASSEVVALAPIWLKSSLQDGAQSPGTAGQVLTSTATQTSWVDAVSLFGGAGTENRGVLWGPNGTLTNSLLLHGSGVNSVGLGIVPQAVGDESIAFTRSTARADYSFALGYESVTDGEFSVTLGKGTYTAGRHAMAANYKSLALGQSSFAGGHTSATGGDGAVALGHNASAGNFGAAKLVSTFPNDQTTFDIEGIVGTVGAGLFMRYGENLDVPDPRIEVLTFTDNGNNSATLTVAAPGIRPIQGELVVFEEATPFRGDHQGGVALGNDAYSLGEGTVSIGHTSVAEADKAVALGDAARSSGASSVAIGKNATATAADTIALGGDSTKILMTALAASASYANDAAAAAGGVSIAELYRNGNAVQIRLT
jgi:hypothetical protein